MANLTREDAQTQLLEPIQELLRNVGYLQECAQGLGNALSAVASGFEAFSYDVGVDLDRAGGVASRELVARLQASLVSAVTAVGEWTTSVGVWLQPGGDAIEQIQSMIQALVANPNSLEGTASTSDIQSAQLSHPADGPGGGAASLPDDPGGQADDPGGREEPPPEPPSPDEPSRDQPEPPSPDEPAPDQPASEEPNLPDEPSLPEQPEE